MAAYNKTIITAKGQALIAKSMVNTDVAFTRVVTSDKDYTSKGNLENLTSIENIKQSELVSEIKVLNRTAVQVVSAFSNSLLTTGYYLRTIGLYATDPDEGEILYSITTALVPDWIPPFGNISITSFEVKLETIVSNSGNIDLNVSPTAVINVSQFKEFKEQVTTQLSDMTQDIEDRGINIKILGADETGSIDISDYLMMASTMVVKGDVVIPRGAFKLSKEIVFNNYVRLKGQGNNVSIIEVDSDINAITFSGSISSSIDTYLQNASCGIEGITIKGLDTNTKPLLSVIFAGRIKFTDVIFSHNGGGALYLRSIQDTMFLDCCFRYCGNKIIDTASVFLDDYSVNSSATSRMNVNDIKFIGCTFEHNNGCLLKSIGTGNNSVSFTTCKFEYGAVKGDPIPIQLTNAERFLFIGCRFTNYYNSGMFELTNCYGIEINGVCYNNTEPSFFANIVDSRAINVRLNGRKIGKVNKSGNTYNLDIKYNEQEHLGRFYYFIMDNTSPNDLVDLRNIHYPDSGAIVVDDSTGTDGIIIRQTTASKQLFFVNINKNQIAKNGVTIWLKLNSNVTTAHSFYLQPTYGSGSLFKNMTINEGESWYSISIPKDSLNESKALVMVTPSGFEGTIELKQMYYEDKYYASTYPVNGTWRMGEEVYNNTPTAGGYEKWKCVVAGTPGMWKGVGLIEA